MSDRTEVYVDVPELGWTRAVVENASDLETTVTLSIDASELPEGQELQMTVLSKQLHPVRYGAFDPTEPDLFRIGDLHAAPLLHCLTARYEASLSPVGALSTKQQYHRMGEMVLSVNPFQSMQYNSNDARTQCLIALEDYHGGRSNLSVSPFAVPHVWHVADNAYRNAMKAPLPGIKRQEQAVLISGESGSGKTENTKALISFLCDLSTLRSQNSKGESTSDAAAHVRDRIQGSNPILEAFGNAKTVRNDNSSRFGKYIRLNFAPTTTEKSPEGCMVGGSIVTYLLERSRVTGCAKGERSYHAFYMLLAGLDAAEKERLFDNPNARAEDFRSLLAGGEKVESRMSSDGTGAPVDEGEEFHILCEALKGIGLRDSEMTSVWTVLAAILRLLQLDFGVNEATGKAFIEEGNMWGELSAVADLLGVSTLGLRDCFCIKARTKVLVRESSPDEAIALRDAFCKTLYQGVFDWLVQAINRAIAPPGISTEATEKVDTAIIGILDIFGFEAFVRNSFEQFCINFANEVLADHYNKAVFHADTAECAREGVPLPAEVVEPDNGACIRLLSKPKEGIFSMLDEECQLASGSDGEFAAKVWEAYATKTKDEKGRDDTPLMDSSPSAYFRKPKVQAKNDETIAIKHYAREVVYHTSGWRSKNVDPLSPDAPSVLQQSTVSNMSSLEGKEEIAKSVVTLVAQLLEPATAADGKQEKKSKTVAGYFTSQLMQLRAALDAAKCSFVRCIKPFEFADAATVTRGLLNKGYVARQLESAAVLQTIELKRQGFPNRSAHKTFAAYFHPLGPRNLMRQMLWSSERSDETLPQISKHVSEDLLSRYSRVYGWTQQPSAADDTDGNVPRAIPDAHYAIGKSVVFTKAAVWTILENNLKRVSMQRRQTALLHLKTYVNRVKKAWQNADEFHQNNITVGAWKLWRRRLFARREQRVFAQEEKQRAAICEEEVKDGCSEQNPAGYIWQLHKVLRKGIMVRLERREKIRKALISSWVARWRKSQLWGRVLAQKEAEWYAEKVQLLARVSAAEEAAAAVARAATQMESDPEAGRKLAAVAAAAKEQSFSAVKPRLASIKLAACLERHARQKLLSSFFSKWKNCGSVSKAASSERSSGTALNVPKGSSVESLSTLISSLKSSISPSSDEASAYHNHFAAIEEAIQRVASDFSKRDDERRKTRATLQNLNTERMKEATAFAAKREQLERRVKDSVEELSAQKLKEALARQKQDQNDVVDHLKFLLSDHALRLSDAERKLQKYESSFTHQTAKAVSKLWK